MVSAKLFHNKPPLVQELKDHIMVRTKFLSNVELEIVFLFFNGRRYYKRKQGQPLSQYAYILAISSPKFKDHAVFCNRKD